MYKKVDQNDVRACKIVPGSSSQVLVRSRSRPRRHYSCGSSFSSSRQPQQNLNFNVNFEVNSDENHDWGPHFDKF